MLPVTAPRVRAEVLAGRDVEAWREGVISLPCVSCAAALAGNHATGSITTGQGYVAAIPATKHRPLALPANVRANARSQDHGLPVGPSRIGPPGDLHAVGL